MIAVALSDILGFDLGLGGCGLVNITGWGLSEIKGDCWSVGEVCTLLSAVLANNVVMCVLLIVGSASGVIDCRYSAFQRQSTS